MTPRPTSNDHRANRDASRPRLFEVATGFLLIGTLAFGGQGGLLALLNRDLVERRAWVTEADVTEAFTYVQLLPGAVVVQVVAYLGWKLRRWPGVAVATSAFLLPSVAVMLGLAIAYRRLAAVNGVSAALGGLTAAVVGLLAVGAAKQARKTVTGIGSILIAAAVFFGSVVFHLNPAIMIIAAGFVGVGNELIRGRARPVVKTPSAGCGGS